MTIGENIKAFRKKRGLSQRELGEKTGRKMTQQQIAQYETGARTPKAGTLQIIADALETPIQTLLPDERYTAEMDFVDVVPSLLQSRLPEGYTLRVDEKDCLLWLEYPDKSISKSISVDDLQAIVQKVMDYMRYELDKLRKD